MKKTRKFSQQVCLGAVIFSFLYCLFPRSSYADPAQYVYVEYDKFFAAMFVIITPASAKTASHYVNTVAIMKNGSKLMTNSYASQPDPDAFTYAYDVSAEDGDVLDTITTCSTYERQQDGYS
jgi:hypothetical protein